MPVNKEWSPLETGTIIEPDGTTHEVDFKTSNTKETLIANHEVNRGNDETFSRQYDDSGNTIPGTGQHNHYGNSSPSWARNDNTTDPERPYYTGPDN